MGTGTMIILDDKTCPVAFIHNMIRFFALKAVDGAHHAVKDFPGLRRCLNQLKKELQNEISIF